MLKYTAEQYRAMTHEELETRKSELLALAESDEKFAAGELETETRALMDEVVRRNAAAELRKSAIADVAAGAGNVITRSKAPVTDAFEDTDYTDSIEYRTAFMQYVTRGKAMPENVLGKLMETRDNANTLTSDVSAVIPTVTINRIIERMEQIGMILPLVTKTSYPAGMNIPVATLRPVASWVAEGASSDRQKYTATASISFTHYKLRCEVSISQEVGVMALSAFESRIVESVAQAMVKAQESAILTGDGSGKPKGILKETPETGQALNVNALDYAALVQAEAAIPEQYESGTKWFMSKKTFMGFVGMVDDNKQPIARVNYGIGGKPERTLLGREVVLTGDYLPNFTASDKKVYAFLFDMADYVLNTNYNMGISRKQDWDTEDLLTKAVMACDGKVIDKGSLVTLTAQAGA